MSALFVQEKNPNGGARLLLAMGEKSRISSCRHFKDNYRATLSLSGSWLGGEQRRFDKRWTPDAGCCYRLLGGHLVLPWIIGSHRTQTGLAKQSSNLRLDFSPPSIVFLQII